MSKTFVDKVNYSFLIFIASLQQQQLISTTVDN